MKVLLKLCLHLLLTVSLYKPKTRNRQRDYVKLVDTWDRGLFHRDCCNILRAGNKKQVNKRARAGIRQGDKRVGYLAQKIAGMGIR